MLFLTNILYITCHILTGLLIPYSNCTPRFIESSMNPGLGISIHTYVFIVSYSMCWSGTVHNQPLLLNFAIKWGGKKLQEPLPGLFCYRFFFFLIVLQGIVITVTNIIDLVLPTIFCMTSLPNSTTSNIITRGRRQQSRRRQRCSRRQRQRQLRGSEVPRAGLGEEDFFAKTLSFRLSFCYRLVTFFLRFSVCWSFDAV